ncbi:MAG: amidohydrolase family protein, partial [Pseudomonadales bacterium]
MTDRSLKPLGRHALLTVLLFLGACTPEPSKTPVDLLLTNGVIIQGAPGAPGGNVMAVKDGRIVAVGGPELADRFIGTVTRDLEGQTVLPGFDDVHSHIHSYAQRYIPLQKITSIDALKGAVQAKAEALGPGEWITGYGWSEDALTEGRKPHRDDLDEAAPDNPVLLTRAGGHSAVANSLALDLGEITLATPQPEGGVIERGEDGRLNGIIRERQDLLAQYIPPPTQEELKESLTASLEALLPLGITAVTHASERLERWP